MTLHRIMFQDYVSVVVEVEAATREEAETLAWEKVDFPSIPSGTPGDINGDWDIVPGAGVAKSDPPTVLARIEELEAENERLRERQESSDLANEAIRWKRKALDAQDAIKRVRELSDEIEATKVYGSPLLSEAIADAIRQALEGDPNE